MVNMAMLPKLIYRFNISPIKILAAFFPFEIDKLISAFMRKCNQPKREEGYIIITWWGGIVFKMQIPGP